MVLGAKERKPTSFMSFRGQRRVEFGNMTSEAAKSPKAKGMCTVAPRVEDAKIAASLFHSPTNLERSSCLSRETRRAIPDAGGNPRPRTRVGSGTIPSVKGALSFSHGNDENSNSETSTVPVMSFQNHPHFLVTSADSRPNHKFLYYNPAFMPVKDIHPVYIETCNSPHSGSLSNSHPVNSDRSNHPSISNPSPQRQRSIKFGRQPSPFRTSRGTQSLLDHSDQDIKEIMLPRTSISKVTEAELTEAAVMSSLVCENLPAHPSLKMKERKQVGTEVGQDRDVEEISFRRLGLRKINSHDMSLRKSTSFELGSNEKMRIDLEKSTKLRKRRRSVSASGIGAMLLKVVHVPNSRAPDTIPMSEERVFPMQVPCSRAEPSSATYHNSHQDVQVEIEAKTMEAIDLDIEFEEIGAPDTDAFPVKVSSCIDDAKRPSKEFIERQLEGDTLLVCTGSRNLNDNADEKREVLSTKIGDCNSHAVPDRLEESLVEERFLDARHNVQDCDVQQRETNPRSDQEKKFNNQENLTENARLNDHRVKFKEGLGGSRRRRPGSRGRISLDMDSSTEWHSKKTEDQLEANTKIEHAQSTTTYHSFRHPLSLLDGNAGSQERPQSFTSVLQVSPQQSANDHPRTQSSILVVANPSFSSSQQDRLWEEQAEAYSSGGRGTPSREDNAGAVNSNVYIQSPSPGGAISSDDQVHCSNAASSLPKSQDQDSLSARSCSGRNVSLDKGHGHDVDRKKSSDQAGKKIGRPRTPLRTLLTEDLDNETPASGFLYQLVSCIKGSSSSSSKASSLTSSSPTMPKRRHSGVVWSICLCFS